MNQSYEADIERLSGSIKNTEVTSPWDLKSMPCQWRKKIILVVLFGLLFSSSSSSNVLNEKQFNYLMIQFLLDQEINFVLPFTSLSMQYFFQF